MRKVVFLILLWFVGLGASAQLILDDTTRQEYGPLTTKYLLESDLLFNQPVYREIDTTLVRSYKITQVEMSDYYYQNLGLEGTALRSIFYKIPENIGVSTGYEVYEKFYRPPSEIRYYNTRSPYSRLSLNIGGGNRSITDVEFSRSDSVNFNFGFNLKKYAIDKQVERQGKGDKRGESTQYDVYTHIKSSNLRYQLLATYTRNRQIMNDIGGLDTTGVGDFFDQEVSQLLQNARTDEVRKALHLYHQYTIRDFLEVYNIVDRYRQRNEFIDFPLGEDANYYDAFFLRADSTADSTNYAHLQYQLGLKGNIGKAYYNAYFKRRSYDFVYKYAAADTLGFDSLAGNFSGIERYFGAVGGFRINDDHQVYAGVEYLTDGHFKITGDLDLKNGYVRYARAKYKPAFIELAYMGNHDFWINDFRPTFAESVDARYDFRLARGRIVLSPGLGYDLINDYIYFNRDTIPVQEPDLAGVLSPEFSIKFNFLKRFTLEATAIYTVLDQKANEIFSIPELFVNSRLFYHSSFFDNNLELVTGVEGHFKSGYYADGYYPVVQQFFLQREAVVEGVPLINAFINFKINRANLYVKFINIYSAATGEGYLVAPLHRALPFKIDFGFTWWFFD